jgi:tetratricopeptide (TPR) repeat protein
MKMIPKHFIGILVCCGLLSGCASMQEMSAPRQVLHTTPENDMAREPGDSSKRYLSKASAYETKGDLQMALFYSTVAASLSPEEKALSRRVSRLKNHIRKQADLHFKEGIRFLRGRQMEKARQAFIDTLRCDPKHEKALDYINSKFSPFKTVSYKVEKGDTKAKIAAKVFLDPDKTFLISYFYDETSGREVLPKGMILNLPYVASPPVGKLAEKNRAAQETPPTEPLETASLPAFNVGLELAKAEELLKDKRYDDALVIADEILDHDYDSVEAEGLINKVYYQKGSDLFEHQHYLDARTVFGYIDPEFIPTQEILAEIKTILNKQAETHYLKGVKFFINEELENAIQEWETVLMLNPEHAKAASDIQDATRLLKKLQEME